MTEISPKLFERLAELKHWTAYQGGGGKINFNPKARIHYRVQLKFKESDFETYMPQERADKLLKNMI